MVTPSLEIEQTRTLVRELARAYSDIRRANVLRGDSEKQTDALAILVRDLEGFCSASADLLSAAHWGPANALARLINERAEYVLAAHEDASFAAEFWNRSAALTEESDRPPRGRSGEARGFVRRVAERRAGTEVSDRLLQSLIAKHDWDSFAVHPNAVTAALAFSACDDESGDNALSIALNVAVATSLALAFLMLVVEERGPADADLSSARALLERAALLIRA